MLIGNRVPLLAAALVALLIGAGNASAAIIGTGSFVSPTVIDFNSAPNGLIGNFYSGQGVTFAHLSGGQIYDAGTGAGASPTATNFFDEPGFPAGEVLFSAPVTRAGFYITTNGGDNTTVSAYLGNVLVGSHVFVTAGNGGGGSFAGVEFLSGFDKLVIDPANIVNGAMAIDDFQFEGTAAVPEPASMTLFGMIAVGGAFYGWRRRKQAAVA